MVCLLTLSVKLFTPPVLWSYLWGHSHDLGVYLRITCTVRGQLYCVYEVTRTTRGVPTGPLARLGVYLRITYMFMECVPAITRTTRGVPSGSLARFRGVRKVSLTQVCSIGHTTL